MTWQIDQSHTRISFNARHMMVAKVRGRFETFEGEINFNEDNPADSTVDVRILTASVNTEEPQRDGHLRSADFFDVENYPVMTFKSKRIEPSADGYSGQLIGDLTIKEVTREVILDVEYTGIVKNPWGAFVAGFSANTAISRNEWGLTWNVALETGGWLVGDKINIEIDVELVKQPEAETEETATG